MNRILSRSSLVSRLLRAEPRVIAMTAPAGFGKTTLARQCMEAWGSGVYVDGDRPMGELDLARRIADGDAVRVLADAGTPVASRLEAALDAWRRSTHRCTVFDRAEQIFASPGARDFIARMLAARPNGHTAIICSREPLRSIPLARFALPHELVVLRASDLAFDELDLREVFAELPVDDALLARISQLTQAWPVAVFLLRRFAEEGRLAALLDRPGDAAFRELHDYFASEVLPSFDEPLQRALFTCAALGDATAEDVSIVGDEAVERLAASGFASVREDGTIGIHPLLGAYVLAGRGHERDRTIRSLAADHETRGAIERAAEIYLEAGDRYSAARALASQDALAGRTLSPRYLAALRRLDTGSLVRFPRLWGALTMTRIFCADSAEILDESETVWRTLPPAAPPAERYSVLAFRVILMSELGKADAAVAALSAFAAVARASDPPHSLLDAHLLYLRGILRARSGAFDAGERDVNAALPLVERMDVAASGAHATLGAEIARVRGEWSVERQFLARAHERALASGLPNFTACVLAEMLIGAWFAGDRQAFNAAAVELETAVERDGVQGFAYLARIARGRSVEPQRADLLKGIAFGTLIALSRSRDEEERRSLAQRALECAASLRIPFVETLAWIAVALCDSKHPQAAANALEAASRCEAPAFVHAVRAFVQQHDNLGMLAPFITHITRDRSEAAPVALDVLAGRVRIDGAAARISGREMELLAAIAQRREPTPRARLAAMLWPDLDEFAARNALSVCLHRLRSHLRRDDAIERDVDGYRLHADAFVDLWEIERAAVVLRSRDRIRDGDRSLLARALERLSEERAATIESWEWFAPVLRRLDDVRTQLAHRLAADALERGDPEAALGFALEIVALDPCDEPAREIAIRAHLAVGDRAAAMRQYRQYREVLRAELSAEPSASLTQLVMSE